MYYSGTKTNAMIKIAKCLFEIRTNNNIDRHKLFLDICTQKCPSKHVYIENTIIK